MSYSSDRRAADRRDAERRAKERRLTDRLLTYWNNLRGDRVMPRETEIDPDALHGLWDYCFLLQVRDLQKADYNYTYLGHAIIEAYRGRLNDMEDPRIVSPNANKLSHHYADILETCQPMVEDGEFTNMSGDRVCYRQCMLPLGEGRTVDAIFGGMRFKIVPQKS